MTRAVRGRSRQASKQAGRQGSKESTQTRTPTRTQALGEAGAFPTGLGQLHRARSGLHTKPARSVAATSWLAPRGAAQACAEVKSSPTSSHAVPRLQRNLSPSVQVGGIAARAGPYVAVVHAWSGAAEWGTPAASHIALARPRLAGRCSLPKCLPETLARARQPTDRVGALVGEPHVSL